jgi:hypothetical protein
MDTFISRQTAQYTNYLAKPANPKQIQYIYLHTEGNKYIQNFV